MRMLQRVLAVVIVCAAALSGAPLLAAGNVVYAVPDSDRARTDLAVILLPVSLDIELLDGMVYPGFKSLFRRGDSQLFVLPGKREIAVRYNQLFQTTVNDHDIVKSKTLVLTFVAEPGKTYRVQHATFRNASEARAGTENFVVQVVDDQGANRIVAATQMQKNWRGEQIVSTRADLVSAAAAAAANAPVAAKMADTVDVGQASGAATAGGSPAAAPGGVSAVDLLRFTWQNASASERAAFLEWVRANP